MIKNLIAENQTPTLGPKNLKLQIPTGIKNPSESTGLKADVTSSTFHFKVSSKTSLLDFLEHQFPETEPGYLQQLNRLGCFYLNQKRLPYDPEKNLRHVLLQEKDYLRVHFQPRRFDVSEIDTHLVLDNQPDFLVVFKPSGVPCHPTVDNYQENLIYQLTQKLNLKTPLQITHRLDTLTCGILLVAKTKKSQAEINLLFSQRKVEKKYHCLADGLLNQPLHLKHFFIESPRAPKEVSTFYIPGSKIGELKIKPLTVCSQKDRPMTFCEVELLTGRTHQIRAQLKKIGLPLFADPVYNPRNSDSTIIPIAPLGLCAFDLQFQFLGRKFNYNLKNHIQYKKWIDSLGSQFTLG